MTAEILKKLIADSGIKPMMKTTLTGFVEMAADWQQQEQAGRELIVEVGRENHLLDVVVNTSEVKIYTVRGTSEDIEYNSIYFTYNNVWRKCHFIAPDLDTALLAYLQQKYLGANSQFAEFAMKMLGMPGNS